MIDDKAGEKNLLRVPPNYTNIHVSHYDKLGISVGILTWRVEGLRKANHPLRKSPF